MDNLGRDMERMMYALMAVFGLGGIAMGAFLFWLIQKITR